LKALWEEAINGVWQVKAVSIYLLVCPLLLLVSTIWDIIDSKKVQELGIFPTLLVMGFRRDVFMPVEIFRMWHLHASLRRKYPEDEKVSCLKDTISSVLTTIIWWFIISFLLYTLAYKQNGIITYISNTSRKECLIVIAVSLAAVVALMLLSSLLNAIDKRRLQKGRSGDQGSSFSSSFLSGYS